jgi:hypothetical protein
MSARVAIGLNAVIVAVTEEIPRILTVRQRGHADALPFGPLDPEGDRTLDRGLRRWVLEQTGLQLGYVEQLYTFGDRGRSPLSKSEQRAVSVAYLALVRESEGTVAEAHWLPVYDFLPWEDGRAGRAAVVSAFVEPRLNVWAATGELLAVRRERRERADIAFGLGGAPWDGDRVLERYELLYEASAVPEAYRDRQQTEPPCVAGEESSLVAGRSMAADHRRMLATALGRLRGKIKYRPVVFELLPPAFTLLQLQRVVEALSGVRLHKQNFRRLVEQGGLVEGTGRQHPETGGRPAELFGFRREVLRERPASGVLPRRSS